MTRTRRGRCWPGTGTVTPCRSPPCAEPRTLVRAVDGVGGIHLAGSWTRDIDSHESAVASAVEVARRLAPHRLDGRGLLPARAPLGFGHRAPS